MGKFFKYLFIISLGLIVLLAIIATPFIIRARMEADRLYERYARYTTEKLDENFDLRPHPVKAEFQTLHPAKFLKLFKISVTSQSGDNLARINSLDATMFLFIKMFTLMIRPEYNYNLPMLSVDIIFIGGKRVYVIEIIDPARIEDANKTTSYARMKARTPELSTFKQGPTRDWFEDFVTDFSIHISADRSNDDLLFDIYKTYLTAYITMAKNAQPLDQDKSEAMRQGIETYVNTLLSKGGPAVDVFKQMLGPQGQREYVRTVMFGID